MRLLNAVVFLLVVAVSGGCTFYKVGTKNDPQIFKNMKNVDTYTSTYFGCEPPYSKPLEKMGYSLLYDKNNELWLQCQSIKTESDRNVHWERVHVGPAPFESRDYLFGSGYSSYISREDLEKWSKDLRSLNLHKCEKNETNMLSDGGGWNEKQVLCASTLDPRREIRLTMDGSNVLVEIADLDPKYRKFRSILDGNLGADQLTEKDLFPTQYATTLKNELLEQILVGRDPVKARAVYAKYLRLPPAQADKMIDSTVASLSTACGSADLGGHAQSMNSLCVAYLINDGADVNGIGRLGTSPIFLAIHGIKVRKQETEESVRIMRMLMSNGADLQYRDNPQPEIFRKKMNALEYLTASRTDGMFDLHAPHAPRVRALFEDAKVMEANAAQLRDAKRAAEIGMSKKELQKGMAHLDELRGKGTFDGFYEAFRLAGAKADFVAAQRLASSNEQAAKLEFLAVLATSDKSRIFDITTSLNDVSADALKNEDNSDSLLFVFKFDSKSSTGRFKGTTDISKSRTSPFDLQGAYKVTARYTLAIPIENKTKVDFILKTESSATDTILRTVTKTFVLKPGSYRDYDTLDFGEVEIAGSTKALGGIGTVERKLAGNPRLTVEIVKVEMHE